MEHVEQVLAQATTFIQSKEFFYYHGLVMSLLWFFASPIGILLRKVSVYLHATVFFLIDVTTAFFIVGALIRVYPYFGYFTSWPLIKQAHISAGIYITIQDPSSLLCYCYSMSVECKLCSEDKPTTNSIDSLDM